MLDFTPIQARSGETDRRSQIIGNELMNIPQYSIATEKDLLVLNELYADMNNKSLMSEAEITKVWHQIHEVPDYYIYLAYL